MIDTSRIKPYIKVWATSGASVLSAKDGWLTAQTPNFTVRVREDIEEFTVPLAKFSSFISKAGKSFSIHQLESGTRLLSGTLSVDVPSITTTPLPIDAHYTLSLPTNTLKELLLFAAAVADPKATMTYSGIVQILAEPDLFEETTSSSVKAFASDGYRAVRTTASCATRPMTMSLPANLVNSVLSFTGDLVEIADTENYIALRCGVVEAVATKFSVNIPDIAKVFGSLYKHRMTVDAGTLKKTLENLNPFLDTATPDVLLSFEQSLVITTGTARDELPYEGTVPFHKFKTPYKHLMDFISKVTGTLTVETDFERMCFTSGEKKYLLAAKQ